jgi:hypothetical protein
VGGWARLAVGGIPSWGDLAWRGPARSAGRTGVSAAYASRWAGVGGSEECPTIAFIAILAWGEMGLKLLLAWPGMKRGPYGSFRGLRRALRGLLYCGRGFLLRENLRGFCGGSNFLASDLGVAAGLARNMFCWIWRDWAETVM